MSSLGSPGHNLTEVHRGGGGGGGGGDGGEEEGEEGEEERGGGECQAVLVSCYSLLEHRMVNVWRYRSHSLSSTGALAEGSTFRAIPALWRTVLSTRGAESFLFRLLVTV